METTANTSWVIITETCKICFTKLLELENKNELGIARPYRLDFIYTYLFIHHLFRYPPFINVM